MLSGPPWENPQFCCNSIDEVDFARFAPPLRTHCVQVCTHTLSNKYNSANPSCYLKHCLIFYCECFSGHHWLVPPRRYKWIYISSLNEEIFSKCMSRNKNLSTYVSISKCRRHQMIAGWQSWRIFTKYRIGKGWVSQDVTCSWASHITEGRPDQLTKSPSCGHHPKGRRLERNERMLTIDMQRCPPKCTQHFQDDRL